MRFVTLDQLMELHDKHILLIVGNEFDVEALPDDYQYRFISKETRLMELL